MAAGRKLKSMTPEGFYQSDEFADLEWNHMRSAILYTYLVRKADDYGFINLDRVMQLSGMEIDTVSPLIEKGFIIRFHSGIAVIVHWGVHSRGEKARRNKTEYRGELAQLITDKYGNYSLKNDTGNDTNNSQEMTQEMTHEMTQNEETADESDDFSEFMFPSRTGADIKQSKTYINQSKQSRDPKQSIVVAVGGPGDSSPSADGEAAAAVTAKKHRKRKPRGELFEYGEFCHVLLSDEEYASLKAKFGEDAVDTTIKNLDGKIENDPRKYNYKNHALTVRNWVERDIANGYIRLSGKQKSQTAVEAERAAYQRDIELSERNAFKFS